MNDLDPRQLQFIVSDAPSQCAREEAGRVRVDIGVPVHDSLDDVRRCLESVDASRTPATRVIVVDDGSGAETSDYLRRYAAKRSGDVFVRHETARGYTYSANEILRRGEGAWVVLLNSDTIVPPGWIERIVEIGARSPDVGVVGPLSNAASWQSAPEVFANAERTDFAVNELPAGLDVETMDALIEVSCTTQPPRVPLLNGFCYAVRRAVIEQVGLFDEEAFPQGYGEENDYSFRVTDAGWAMAIATNTYVFHAKSRSFTHERRRALSKRGSEAFRARWPAARIGNAIESMREHPVLAEKRLATRLLTDAVSTPGLHRHDGFSVLFIADCAPGGGGVHSIVQETQAMRRLGVKATVAVPREHVSAYDRLHPDLAGDARFVYRDEDELIEAASDHAVVVATIFNSIAILEAIIERAPDVMPAYYAQDYEPWFFSDVPERQTLRTEPETRPESRKGIARRLQRRADADASYTRIKDILLFAKTRWIAGMIEANHSVRVFKVRPSLDHKTYHPPDENRRHGPVRVAAMVRVTTPRRAPHRTMEVLARLVKELDLDVEVHVFGSDERGMTQEDMRTDFRFNDHGVLDRKSVADLLRDADVFVDFSDYQAFGRTALEAMACGCAVVVPRLGGSGEYAQHRSNALVVDTSDEGACLDAVRALVTDSAMRTKIASRALRTAREYGVESAARSELVVLKSAWELRGWRQVREATRASPGGATLEAPAQAVRPSPTSLDDDVLTYDVNAVELERNLRHCEAFRADPRIDPRRLAWFIPSFDHILRGGLRTIFMAAESFSIDRGTHNLIVVCGRESASMTEIETQARQNFPQLKADFVSLPTGADPNQLPETDAAFATLWTTAYALVRYDKCRGKFYFMQDFEPSFVAAGSVSALIEQTYRFGFCVVANSPGVAEVARRYDAWVGAFIPGVDGATFHPDPSPRRTGPRRVVFYGRPKNMRNGFRLGVEALRLVKEQLGDSVEIVSAGAQWRERDFGLEGVIRNLGVLPTIDDVASLYRSCDAGLVFMYTAHPSYQPLEWMASGCATVTNENLSNSWLLRDRENCRLVQNTISCAAEGLLDVLSDNTLRRHILEGGLHTASTLDWNRALADIRSFVERPQPYVATAGVVATKAVGPVRAPQPRMEGTSNVPKKSEPSRPSEALASYTSAGESLDVSISD